MSEDTRSEADVAEHLRRLAEDYADACVRAGYVTTIKCDAWHRLVRAIADATGAATK